jgi:cytochrome oxidase assembly protein ShyY1
MKLLQWTVALLTTIILALGTWGLSSVSGAKETVARIDTRVINLEKQFEKIDAKLDRLLEGKQLR